MLVSSFLWVRSSVTSLSFGEPIVHMRGSSTVGMFMSLLYIIGLLPKNLSFLDRWSDNKCDLNIKQK